MLEPGLRRALATGSLDLELVETALLETSAASTSFVAALRELGATFSIDDFGTGYGFLAQLRDYPSTRSRSTVPSSPASIDRERTE